MAAMDHVASVVVAATSPNFVDGGTLVTVVAVAASVSVIVSLFGVVLVGAVVTLVLVLRKKFISS